LVQIANLSAGSVPFPVMPVARRRSVKRGVLRCLDRGDVVDLRAEGQDANLRGCQNADQQFEVMLPRKRRPGPDWLGGQMAGGHCHKRREFRAKQIQQARMPKNAKLRSPSVQSRLLGGPGCKKGWAVLWQAQSDHPQRENRSNSRRAEVSYTSAPGNGSSADTAVAQWMGSPHPKRPPND
jgi:hypothetical protein